MPRESVSRERAEDDLRAKNKRNKDDAVEEIPGERRRRPGAAEIVERQRRVHRKSRRKLRGMESGPHRVNERQYPEDRQQP